MKRSSILIVVIWALILVDALRQGLSLPNSELAEGFGMGESALTFLPFPFAFFALAAFFQRRKLFDIRFLRKAVDAKFGEGAYISFIERLKPGLLFMSFCVTLGAAGLITTYLSTKTDGAYVISGSFLSAGLGLLTAYLLSIRFPPRLR
jgi:hypothetical protein